MAGCGTLKGAVPILVSAKLEWSPLPLPGIDAARGNGAATGIGGGIICGVAGIGGAPAKRPGDGKGIIGGDCGIAGDGG